MVATQPTFNQVLGMAYMLSYGEQQQLINYVQGNIYEHIHRVEDTPDELKARLREAHRQVEAGEVYSQEEAHQMMHEFVEQRLSKKQRAYT
ncbi:MAG: hypothetical protein IKT19_05055 [Paludibacteraceae bacterium]|nr:hypothetical protein [Paludibacteraceae bacterium]